jgi:hypothetical protein
MTYENLAEVTVTSENDCPFQIKKGISKEHIVYNTESGLKIYTGPYKTCENIASHFNTEWFFWKYVG